jgi:actin
MEDEVIRSIIIDNGTSYIKAGLDNEKTPRVFGNYVGYPKYSSPINIKNYYVGEEAEEKSITKLKYPMEHGVVFDWDNMEKIWRYIFDDKLKVEPYEYNILLTEAANNPRRNKEKMGEIMFETFGVCGIYIEKPGVLSLYAEGKFNGIAVDLGGAVSQFIPIYDGYTISKGVIRLDFGGKDLTEYMIELLNESEEKFYKNSEKILVEKIKKKACYVTPDSHQKYAEKFEYKLPDGTHIIVKDERIKVPEALFDPWLVRQYAFEGIAKTCFDSIHKCEIDTRKDVCSSIILCGGNSMFEGLPERFKNEIKYLSPESLKEEVNVIASPERKFDAWIGGTILSSISTTKWVTKSEYEESGSAIIHERFKKNMF